MEMLGSVLFFLSVLSAQGTLDLFKGEEQLSFECDVDLREPFSCICLHPGLWRVYSSCAEFETMAVNTRTCFNPREQISRVERIASGSLSPTVLNAAGSREFRWEAILLQPDDLLVVRTTKTVSDGTRSLCLEQPSARAIYCLFPNQGLISILTAENGCSPDSVRLSPKDCIEFTEGPSDCSASGPAPDSALDDLRRPKRMFLPWTGVNVTPVADASDPLEDDEDFYKEDGKKKSNQAVTTEIWNYFDRQTDLLLGLRTQDYVYKYVVPVFQILDLSRRIFKKTCPPWYVSPAFIDLSVDSFIQLIRKRHFFTEYGNDFEGLSRVMEALTKCEANMTFFPFSQFQKDKCNKTIVETGHYRLYGQESEMNIPENSTSWKHEPIIDTAWKVFYNAHQYCFDFFGPHYNDHHRYGVLMETLFQSPVYKIWFEGETRNDLFGGFLGELKEVTDRVSYCAMTSSLETEYPWDIPRPAYDELATRLRRSIPSRHEAALCARSPLCRDDL